MALGLQFHSFEISLPARLSILISPGTTVVLDMIAQGRGCIGPIVDIIVDVVADSPRLTCFRVARCDAAKQEPGALPATATLSGWLHSPVPRTRS